MAVACACVRKQRGGRLTCRGRADLKGKDAKRKWGKYEKQGKDFLKFGALRQRLDREAYRKQ